MSPPPSTAAPAPAPRAPRVAHPEVSLLVLAHDTPREVQALLDSIVRNTREPYEILLIDNGSSFAGREAHTALAEAYGARLIPLDANVTFSIANNLGVRVAIGREVVLLNSDVEVTHDWLRNLRAALHSAPDVAIVGPRTTFSRAAQGGVWLDDSTPTGVQQFGRFFNHSDPTRWFETDWLAGFALLARRTAWDAVGGLDETIPWHGLEDRALGDALRAAGWRALVAGDTFVYHAGHRTFEGARINRTATRIGRPSVAPAAGSSAHGRLIKDSRGLVFEVRDGVACHLEIPPGLIADRRRIEDAAAGELDELSVGPPISACRVRGTDEVWVLHGAVRRPVRGDPQRIRRLPWVWQAEPGELDHLADGPVVQVEDALAAVPDIPAWLPFNPAELVLERLAGVETVAAEIGAAIDAEQGYALIRLEPDDVLVLNQEMWPARPLDPGYAGVSQDPAEVARALRQAIVAADAVAVTEDPSPLAGTPLLQRVMFHYDLYPRRMCSSRVSADLMGIDPETGARTGPGPLAALLAGRRIALVCSEDPGTENQPSRSGAEDGLDVRLVVGLDELSELDSVFRTLAAQRGAFDVVLAATGLPAKPLCARLARELDIIALDMGSALDDVVYPPVAVAQPEARAG